MRASASTLLAHTSSCSARQSLIVRRLTDSLTIHDSDQHRGCHRRGDRRARHRRRAPPAWRRGRCLRAGARARRRWGWDQPLAQCHAGARPARRARRRPTDGGADRRTQRPRRRRAAPAPGTRWRPRRPRPLRLPARPHRGPRRQTPRRRSPHGEGACLRRGRRRPRPARVRRPDHRRGRHRRRGRRHSLGGPGVRDGRHLGPGLPRSPDLARDRAAPRRLRGGRDLRVVGGRATVRAPQRGRGTGVLVRDGEPARGRGRRRTRGAEGRGARHVRGLARPDPRGHPVHAARGCVARRHLRPAAAPGVEPGPGRARRRRGAPDDAEPRPGRVSRH